jgi:hypothetical protein
VISGNTIETTLEETAAPVQGLPFGIGFWSLLSPQTSIENVTIANNIVSNMPGVGIRFSSAVTNALVVGNQLINPGSTLNQGLADTFRSGVLIAGDGNRTSGIRIINNVIEDDLDTSRMSYGIVFAATNSPGSLQAIGNVISVKGRYQQRFIRAYHIIGSAQRPLIRGISTQPLRNPRRLPNGLAAPGSEQQDTTVGTSYRWRLDVGRWEEATPAKRIAGGHREGGP